MPKFVTDKMAAKLQQKTGTEPFIAIQVNWYFGTTWYSTRAAKNISANANVLSVGPIRNERRSDNMCNIGTTRVKFSDTDGAMKSIVDLRNPERAPAVIYLAFIDVGVDDFVPLIYGKTVGPVIWNQDELTLELGIEIHVTNQQFGFTATENDFSDINPEASGVPWPIIFGSCVHVPALHIRRHAEGHLQNGIRLWQSTPFNEILSRDKKKVIDILMRGNPIVYAYLNDPVETQTLYIEGAETFPPSSKHNPISIIISNVVFTGYFVNNLKFHVLSSNDPKFVNLRIGTRLSGPDNKNTQVLWLQDYAPIANHHCYFKTANNTEWYNFCIRQEGLKCWFRFPFSSQQKPYNPILMDSKEKITEVYGITKCGASKDISGDILKAKDALQFRRMVDGQSPFGFIKQLYDKLVTDATSWWTSPPDVEVRYWNYDDRSIDPDIYIASLSTLSEVKAVYGKRRVDVAGKTQTILVQIPTSYYRVVNGSFAINQMIPTAIIFDIPLCDYPQQNWLDDVFVSGTATIGNNPITIIEWIIANFTDLRTDPLMFQTASEKVLPCNFAMFDKREALRVCEEIAFQSKCGLLLDNGGIGPVYLAIQPAQQYSFKESDIKKGSLQLHFTEVKDIFTKLVISYTDNYKDKNHLAESHELNIREFERVLRSLLPSDTRNRSETKFVIYTNNTSIYGTHIREEPAFIYNDRSSVQSMADFWGFRLSNSWRLVTFKTWLVGVRLQPFDGIAINFNNYDYLKSNLVPGLVDSVEFNPSDFTTTIQVWLPIKAGGVFIEAAFWPG